MMSPIRSHVTDGVSSFATLSRLSAGSTCRCFCRGCGAGLGEPCLLGSRARILRTPTGSRLVLGALAALSRWLATSSSIIPCRISIPQIRRNFSKFSRKSSNAIFRIPKMFGAPASESGEVLVAFMLVSFPCRVPGRWLGAVLPPPRGNPTPISTFTFFQVDAASKIALLSRSTIRSCC